jgi:tol-pal system protein YbgF
MNMLLSKIVSNIRSVAIITFIASPLSVSAQSAALTPEQLTQQLRVLSERQQNASAEVNSLRQEVTRMGRLIDNRAMIELMQSVEGLASEISQMRGELEQQTHDTTEIKKRQRELYLDIDRRLRALESRAVSVEKTEPVEVPGLDEAAEAAQTTTQPSQTVIEPSVNADGLIADTSVPLVSSNDSESGAAQSSASNSEERVAYQAAFDTLKEGRYKIAKTELKRFLEKYPDSTYAGNAQYWLGEAYYVTRDFDQGILEFELVLSRYPSSPKVADAMLKLGYTYYEKQQYNKARIMLDELRKRYPKATAARLAGKRLERMRKEGH